MSLKKEEKRCFTNIKTVRVCRTAAVRVPVPVPVRRVPLDRPDRLDLPGRPEQEPLDRPGQPGPLEQAPLGRPDLLDLPRCV